MRVQVSPCRRVVPRVADRGVEKLARQDPTGVAAWIVGCPAKVRRDNLEPSVVDVFGAVWDFSRRRP